MRLATALKSTVIALLLVVLNACGGGGGGSSNDVPAAQPFTFAQAGPITLYNGQTFTNIASGPGADGVSYESANPEIARVDGATGEVTVLKDGTAVIVANKLVNIPNNTAQLVAGHASYTINSSAAPLAFEQAGPISLNAGDKFTNTVSGPGPGVNYYESSDTNVAVVDSATGVVTATGPSPNPVTITGYKLVTVSFHTSALIASKTTYQIVVSAPPLAFDHVGPIDLYVRDKYTNTVTGSGQGVPFYESSDVTVATVDSASGQVTVNGPGPVTITATKQYTDPTTSTVINNGTATYTINAQASGPAFTARFAHTVTSFNNQLWLIGGLDNSGYKNDVWSSPDGITWTRQTDNAGFTPRGLHQVVVFNNQLWLIGGFGGTNSQNGAALNDVWSSPDGITWTQQTIDPASMFSVRAGHQAVIYNNQILVIGGYQPEAPDPAAPTVPRILNFSDVWASSDGVSWARIKDDDNSGFSARNGHQVVVYNGQLWLVGGEGVENGRTVVKNDVWSSTDGIAWTQQAPTGLFSAREGHQVVVFNSQLWLLGGYDNTGSNAIYYNDVWASSDGIAWTKETGSAPFWPRYYHQVVVSNNQLLLLGGIARSPDGSVQSMLESDAWTSSDGINWDVLYRGAFQSP